MKKLRELMEDLEALKKEARSFLDEGKVEEARAKTDEAKLLREKIDLLKELEDKEDRDIEDKIDKEQDIAKKEQIDSEEEVRAFVNVLRYNTGIEHDIDKEDLEIVRAIMKESSPEDGGLTVPKDIQTKIKELRRSFPDNLEQYVNVEKVNTLSGTRIIEKNADYVPFDKVNEGEIFPDADNPKFEEINYKVDKFGGLIGLTYELLEDTSENLIDYITRWAAKKGKATRNAFILKVLEDEFDSKAVKTTDELKEIFNVDLDPAIALTSMAIMNQDAFNALDTLKDETGKYILQPNPADPTTTLLFGKYPIAILNNKTLPTKSGKAPIICGDLEEGLTLFDRENFGLDANDRGTGWNKDVIDIKARERIDVKPVDDEAVVIGKIQISAIEATKAAQQKETETDKE